MLFTNSSLASGVFCHQLITFEKQFGSKPFDTLTVLLKYFFQKVNFEKSQQRTHNAWKCIKHLINVSEKNNVTKMWFQMDAQRKGWMDKPKLYEP